MKKQIIIDLLAIVLFSTFSLGSITPTVFAEKIITLEDAYRSVLFRSEHIKIMREGLLQAEEEARRAKSGLYPTLTADLDYLRRPREKRRDTFILRSESETRFTLSLEQPLYAGGRAWSRYRSAQLGRKGEVLNLSLLKEDLLFETAKIYYDTLKSMNNVKIGEKEVERLQAHRHSAEQKVQVGEVTKTALLLAEAELSDAQAKLIRARNDELTQKDQLALLTRIEGPFELADPTSVPLLVQSKSEWIALSYRKRIELKQAWNDIDEAKEEIVFTRGSFLPMLSLDLEYRWIEQDPQGDFLIQEDPVAILKLTFPIFEGMLRVAELGQARSRLRQANFIKQRMKDEIEVSVKKSILDLSTLTGELDHLRDRVRFAKEAYTLASRQFDVGLGTHIDVLDANSVLLDAERRFFNAVYDREIAILKLRKETGSFLPLGNVTVND